MTAEFNWWLLLLGLLVGGGLTWLVVFDSRRREQDLEDDELPDEAAWLEERLAEEGDAVPVETIERIVQLHRTYLAVVPPEDPADEWPDGTELPASAEPGAHPHEAISAAPHQPPRDGADKPDLA